MIALDLFAGTGWGVACHDLGITEWGVELMPEAIATRKQNGMLTLYRDVWDGLEGDAHDLIPRYDLLIGSPPCQTFSPAGNGAGRRALDTVLRLVDEGAYERVADLRAFGESHDPRTALVLTPLAYIARDRPEFVVLEQVPAVLPVWEKYAAVMRGWGYSVWTGKLHAEQYGVPQTRIRAFLIARRDGRPALPPEPTHSRYYPHDPARIDLGVPRWVNMADALGWDVPPGELIMRSNYGTGGDPAKRGERGAEQPAPTMTSKADRNMWILPFMSGASGTSTAQRPRALHQPAHTITGAGIAEWHDAPNPMPRLGMRPETTRRVSVAEAARLQSYPDRMEWCGTKGAQYLQVGNAVPPLLARAVLSTFV